MGLLDGTLEGIAVGILVGTPVGLVGLLDGCDEGCEEGADEGIELGCCRVRVERGERLGSINKFCFLFLCLPSWASWKAETKVPSTVVRRAEMTVDEKVAVKVERLVVPSGV